jgi:hypothetical protein
MKPAARFVPLFLITALSCEVQTTTAPLPTLALDKQTRDGRGSCDKGEHRGNPNAPISLLCVITVPGNPIVSSDIAWVDPRTERYYIADRSNSGVDIIDAEHDVYVGRVGGMAGGFPTTPGTGGGTATTNGAGPNGVVVTPNQQLWVGDGNSTVRVADVDPDSPNYLKIIASINTAIDECDDGTLHYCGRADEIGYDPEHHIILIAHPSPLTVAAPHAASVGAYAMFITAPGYTLSAVPPYTVLGHHHFHGAGGLEQPLWDPDLHRFLLTVPNDTALGGVPAIAVINDSTRKVENTYTLDCKTLNGTTGGAITGIALGEAQHLLVSACGNPIILNALTGDPIAVIKQVGGGDEVWFNRGDGRFYVTGPATAAPGLQSLGVIDGETSTWRQNVTDIRGKNPAAFAENNHIFTVVQITAAIAAGTATDSSTCSLLGVRRKGCVAVYGHSDRDGHSDRVGGGERESH